MDERKNTYTDKEIYIERLLSLDVLRLITCGSVDDGKSTLIGRLLYESGLIYDDQLLSLTATSREFGSRSGEIDFSFLLDGLTIEREQGITIDVAYRYFSTSKRRFIVGDTPGHEQYTRNTVTAASTADLAILLIDASSGLQQQTKRHSLLCNEMGVKHVLIAINKMDLVNYDKKSFNRIRREYLDFARCLDFLSIELVPISALCGDNIVEPSPKLGWYHGPSLLSYLENLEVRSPSSSTGFALPIQSVIRGKDGVRNYAGTISNGILMNASQAKILPSGRELSIREINILGKNQDKAIKGQSITVRVDREIDISRGDVLASLDSSCNVSDNLKIKIIWLGSEKGYIGRKYILKIGTNEVGVKIDQIEAQINIDSLKKQAAKYLECNELYNVSIRTDEHIVWESYRSNRDLGAVIFIDKYSHQTVAAGMIESSVEQYSSVSDPSTGVSKFSRRKLNGHNSKVIWFTGVSGAGKSTLAYALEERLHRLGIRTYILDGDNVRQGLNSGLGFSDADRIENIRRVSEVAKILVDAGIVVICAFISPFRAERDSARALFENDEFIEVYVSTPMHVAEKRDPKALYKKARSGELANFTGVGSTYERPTTPELEVSTEYAATSDIVDYILSKISFY